MFNQQAMSPGNGQEVTIVVEEGASVYKVAKTLEKKVLWKMRLFFMCRKKLSNYSGQIKPGTYLLSTAYTPVRIMGILAGDEEQEGAETT